MTFHSDPDSVEKGEARHSPFHVYHSPTKSSYSSLVGLPKSILSWKWTKSIDESESVKTRLPVWNSVTKIFRPHVDNTIVRKLQSCTRGYSRQAAFLDSDESFMIYRRFGWIQARLLLEKQDELRLQEEELGILDEELRNKDVSYPTTRDLPEEEKNQMVE